MSFDLPRRLLKLMIGCKYSLSKFPNHTCCYSVCSCEDRSQGMRTRLSTRPIQVACLYKTDWSPCYELCKFWWGESPIIEE